MKKSTMLATAAFAVLLGLFVPCTSHATEIKDTDPTTVQWDKATVEEKTDADNNKYLLYTLPNTNYDSYDDAITGLAKYMVDATADRKYNSVSVLFPFTVVTDKTIDEAVDMSVDIDDKIDNWIRFGGNMTKREILSFSGSDWKNMKIYHRLTPILSIGKKQKTDILVQQSALLNTKLDTILLNTKLNASMLSKK